MSFPCGIPEMVSSVANFDASTLTSKIESLWNVLVQVASATRDPVEVMNSAWWMWGYYTPSGLRSSALPG